MRPYKPWFRAGNNTWYVEIAGKQQPLGKHPEDAPAPRKGKSGWNAPQEITTAFHRLMVSSVGALPDAESLRVAVVCDLFLDYLLIAV